MSNDKFNSKGHIVVDQYDNQFEITSELARGGQGVVYRTTDPDLAVKQPLGPDGRPDKSSTLQDDFARIRCLPLPANLPISLPVSILKSEPGYVMTLLNEMKPFGSFYLNGENRDELDREPLPNWLSGMPSRDAAAPLMFYAKTGSSKRRHYALYKCAALLARLHAVGLIYGDVSPNNAFIAEGDPCEVWLIDADNLRLERAKGGQSVYSPRYGAPEVVRGIDSSRPYSDIWAFSVMAFEMLSLEHPFIGRAVLKPDDDEGGWDSDDWNAEPEDDERPADLDDQAYMGFLPFIDDELDDSNEGMTGLPRQLVMTPFLRHLYQETLGVGREKYWRRSSMMLWALGFAQAHDSMVICPDCHMSYFIENDKCPFCDYPHPAYAEARTPEWSMVIQDQGSEQPFEAPLPHRLFNAFSLEHGDDTEYEAVVDFGRKEVTPVRGTRNFPAELTFKFVEGGRNEVR